MAFCRKSLGSNLTVSGAVGSQVLFATRPIVVLPEPIAPDALKIGRPTCSRASVTRYALKSLRSRPLLRLTSSSSTLSEPPAASLGFGRALLTISKLLRSYIMADETMGRGLVDDRNSDPSEAASHHLASA